MAKAIHTMIRVLDLQKAMNFYAKALDFGVADQYDFDNFNLVYLRNVEIDFEIELPLNKDRSEPYSHGDGYGHIAVCVGDLDQEHMRFMNSNWLRPASRNFIAMKD